MGSRRGAVMLLLTLVIAALASCGGRATDDATPTARGDDAITVGSFDFAESEVLAEIYSQALESGGYDVVRAFGLGAREFVAPALVQGLVELVPEYAGTALQFLSVGQESATADERDTHQRLAVAATKRGITALRAAPAQDANAFVVTRETAQRHGLHTVSDLGAVAGTLTFGGPPECPTRRLCLAGLADVYGVSFREFLSLDAGGPVTRQALTGGYVDVALLFTTDPLIASGDFIALDDDRRLQPAENVTPLIRREVVDRWGPRLVASIDAVSQRLTTDDLRQLNAQVVAEGAEPRDIAAAWLRMKGLR
jgi:osmoprotectant transport system substrate-binding protein